MLCFWQYLGQMELPVVLLNTKNCKVGTGNVLAAQVGQMTKHLKPRSGRDHHFVLW